MYLRIVLLILLLLVCNKVSAQTCSPDITNPTVVCQDITIQLDGTGNVTITAADVDNGSTDNCGIATTVIDVTSFNCTNIGANNVILTVTDVQGNSDSCTAVVTVVDAIQPTIICKDITINLGASGSASISPEDIDDGSSDNCTIVLSADKTGFSCNDLGANTVTLTVTDSGGNTNSCTAIVTVLDTEAPIITCPNNITVNNDPGVCEAIVNFTVPTDGSLRINTGALTAGPSLATSGGATNWSVVAYNPNLNIYYSFRAGNTRMPFRTYDDQGNTLVTNETGFDFRGLWWNPNTGELQGNGVGTSGYRTVTLDGNGYATNGGVNFVVGANQPNNQSNGTYDYHTNEILFYHGGRLYSYDMQGNQVSDRAIVNFPEASNGDITTRSIGYTGVLGAEIVIYSELNARVYFIDKATATYYGDFLDMPAGAPTPNNYGFAYANGYVFLREDATADPWVSYQIVVDDRLDNCDGTLISQTNGLTSGSLFPVGTTTVEFKATDSSGNESFCSFDIIVNDNEAPNAICQNIRVQLDATGNAIITAADVNDGSTDNCGIDTLALDISTFDCTNIGANNVVLTVTDAAGNNDTCTAIVTVEDNVLPIMVCQDITILLDGTGNATITAAQIDNGSSDNCSIDNVSLDQSSFTLADLGNNTVTLTAEDASGNSASCTAKVNVEDGVVMNVLGNGTSIINGDITPDINDHTEFISVVSTGTSSSTFTIDNSAGVNILHITNISISGTGAAAFSLGALPTSVAAGTSETFDIDFAPATDGTFDALVTIESNDSDADPYTFSITGQTGVAGETFNFDGTNDYALANINSSSTDFTLEAWFKADSGASGYRAIMVWQKTGANKETSIEVSGAGLIRLGQYDYTVNRFQQVFSTTNVKDDQWHHVAAVKISDIWTLYIDGVEEGTLTLRSNNAAYTDLTDFRIGNIQLDSGGLSEHFRGEIDEVRIWDYARTCREILDQMNCELTGSETDLLAYYDFEQGVSGGNNRLETQVLDQGPNGYHATLYNTTLSGTTSNWIAPGSGVNSTGCIALAPEITVAGNGQLITNGDTIPDVLDGSAFGTVSTGDTASQTFTISNNGGGTLEITGITISGSEFSLASTHTFPINIATGTSQDFDVSFLSNSCTASDFNGNVQIDSNDCLIGTFTYDLSASVIDNIDPTPVCQDFTVQLDATGNTSIYSSQLDNGSSDTCDILFSFTGSPLISQTIYNTNNNSRGHGQSFIATVTGVLTKVRVLVNSDYTNRTVHFYNGSGSGISNNIGTPVYTETGVTLINSNGGSIWSEVILSTPFPVIAGNTYAFAIEGNTDIYYAWNDRYSDGEFIWRYDTSSGCCVWGDLAFEIEFDEILDFGCTDVGMNTISLLVTDSSGNTSTCNSIVTVEDTIQPTVVCQDITVQLDATGNATITAVDIDNGSSDACGIASMVLDTTSFDCSDVGLNTVTLTVTDVNGNSDSCTSTVTVEDNVQPTVVCQDIIVQLDATGNATITAAQIDNGSNDACGIASMVLDTTSFDCSGVGLNTVTLTVTDTNGNVDSCTARVTVEDNVQPTVVCQDITVQLDATGNATITAAQIDNGSSDACGIVSMVLDTTSFDCSDVGLNTVTLTVIDVNGNSDSCTATVTVEDNVQPTVVCQDITIQLDATGNATITAAQIDNGSNDACGIASMVLDTTSFDCSDVGLNTVTLTVTDTNGNFDSCTARVTVEDNVQPTVVCQDITVQLDATGNAMITAAQIDNGSSDACGIASMVLDTTSFDCSDVGSNTVTLTVIDVNGNSDSCTATVTVEDNVQPTVVCQDITVQLDVTGNATITTAQIDNGSNDACGVISMTLNQNTFDCYDIGVNTVILTAVDTNGNSTQCTALVTVEDSVGPTVLCQDITIELDINGNASIAAYQLDNGSFDSCGIDSLSIDVDTFDCSNIGENTVVLTAIDRYGNSSSCSAIVTVEDVISPGAICQNITVQLDDTGNATITPDQINNDSTDICGIADITIDRGHFDCSDVGRNFVLMTVTDLNGNISRCTAEVTVIDPILPVAICQGITVQLDETGSISITPDQINNGSYNFCGNLTLSLDRTEFTTADIGDHIVTLTATDVSGNSAMCTSVVTIIDSVEPVITLLGDNPQMLTYGTGYTELGALISDGYELVIDTSDFMDFPGTYSIRYNAMNSLGELRTQVLRTVIVEGTDTISEEDIPIAIYPNPATDSFSINTNREIEAVELYDMRGRKVETFIHEAVNSPMSLEKLATGMYWVKIYLSPKGLIIEKIMVER
ncbi:HYR domain-containing protein [Aquimarina litoralis]|uniref:HYR domain-containing protein n=1 Tax=Aquimarina litoralis TaxID=584605 RepID=UPI001C584319|nr:HYR domain-containing protein [Aquimarina litoralis]